MFRHLFPLFGRLDFLEPSLLFRREVGSSLTGRRGRQGFPERCASAPEGGGHGRPGPAPLGEGGG